MGVQVYVSVPVFNYFVYYLDTQMLGHMVAILTKYYIHLGKCLPWKGAVLKY